MVLVYGYVGMGVEEAVHTIDNVANFLISLIALGALFLNETPWTYFRSGLKSVFRPMLPLTLRMLQGAIIWTS